MPKIAVFSDVHGNYTALAAVYADAQSQGVSDYWFLGDLYSPGPGANDLWKLFQKMNPSVRLKGNWEDLLLKGIAGQMSPVKPSRVYFSKLAQSLGSRLQPGILTEIANWSTTAEVDVSGQTISLSHNLPDENKGQKLYPTAPQANFEGLFAENSQADMAIYAHVHHPQMRYSLAEQLILNPGSVGQPFSQWAKQQADLRASYLILNINDQGFSDIDFRKVAYDHEAELSRAQAVQIPYLDLYKEQLTTGRVHSHDHALLTKLNDQRGYLADVMAYNAAHQKQN